MIPVCVGTSRWRQRTGCTLTASGIVVNLHTLLHFGRCASSVAVKNSDADNAACRQLVESSRQRVASDKDNCDPYQGDSLRIRLLEWRATPSTGPAMQINCDSDWSRLRYSDSGCRTASAATPALATHTSELGPLAVKAPRLFQSRSLTCLHASGGSTVPIRSLSSRWHSLALALPVIATASATAHEVQ